MAQATWTGLAVTLVILAALGWLIGRQQVATSPSGEQAGVPIEEQPTVLNTVSYQGEDGKTALELLRAGHDVEVKESELGTLVIKIDGVGGEGNAFWLYYVDVSPAEMGADKYVTKNGETIEWRYEQF